jgi:hypothetical protein
MKTIVILMLAINLSANANAVLDHNWSTSSKSESLALHACRDYLNGFPQQKVENYQYAEWLRVDHDCQRKFINIGLGCVVYKQKKLFKTRYISQVVPIEEKATDEFRGSGCY